MATKTEFSNFLKKTELRAYKQALFAVRNEQDALDIVQDAMMKLTRKYNDKPVEELPLLFQKILQNTIHDHYRHQKTQLFLTTHFSSFTSYQKRNENDLHDYDYLEAVPMPDNLDFGRNPDSALEQTQIINIIEKALETLPSRQREAFLLRYWEGMDVNETSIVMGCSEGSVKTHCFRAVTALASILQERGIRL
ncbi:RNA polymerase sigma-70 factor, ECF subfamily [Nitrosomonas marina]|uniref:RNA polymerase sigma-70 factor, ECF subfamily n=1 Tax=Nitrosomonas marina TaxID=917 RepID=A0A1I0CJX0_9PROT|nr:RNA polymerase sigma factor [Nitrosomonas marina]SET19470.1 RNA polymerase sigma-70 factor, ECF subfamily [Nitrosomonas marina]